MQTVEHHVLTPFVLPCSPPSSFPTAQMKRPSTTGRSGSGAWRPSKGARSLSSFLPAHVGAPRRLLQHVWTQLAARWLVTQVHTTSAVRRRGNRTSRRAYSHVAIGASMPLLSTHAWGCAHQPSADAAWGQGATLRDACKTAPACAVGIRVLCLDASPRSPARIQGS